MAGLVQLEGDVIAVPSELQRQPQQQQQQQQHPPVFQGGVALTHQATSRFDIVLLLVWLLILSVMSTAITIGSTRQVYELYQTATPTVSWWEFLLTMWVPLGLRAVLVVANWWSVFFTGRHVTRLCQGLQVFVVH